ncbi:MAG: RNA polymerase sigma factor [Opitutales bacterium]|nr:RNA polymerase sigma factor [Opitutales bacterium]
MNEYGDNEIMRRVSGGNLEDLTILYQRYHMMLFAFFMKRTRQKCLSEDLVQEVFLRVMKYRKSFNPEHEFASWLFVIARNVQHSAGKKASRDLHIVKRDEVDPNREVDDAPSSEPLPDEETDRRLKTDLLYEALEMLTPDNRKLVVLRRMQHLEYSKIAELLDCEMGSLRVKTHRAFNELKKQYQILLRRKTNGLSVI